MDVSPGGSFVFFGEQASAEPEAYNPEVYNSVPMLVSFGEPIKIYFLIWNH